jgi:hypothetical protein
LFRSWELNGKGSENLQTFGVRRQSEAATALWIRFPAKANFAAEAN